MTRVSIGLPVYNGEIFIKQAIESLISQTYENLEIIILDNASTDNTYDICKNYADKSRKIKLLRNSSNIGAAANFNKIFNTSTGDYFKWAACDDYILDDYIQKCVDVLDNMEGVILVNSQTGRVDENNIEMGEYAFNMDTNSTYVVTRFRDLISIRHNCVDVFGLMRREILLKTPLIADYIGSDRNLLAELALYGRFFEIKEKLFFRRDHAGCSCRANTKPKDLSLWFNPNNKGIFYYPEWKCGYEYIKTLIKSDIKIIDKIACYQYIFMWAISRKMWLLSNIIQSIKILLRLTSIGNDIFHVLKKIKNKITTKLPSTQI